MIRLLVAAFVLIVASHGAAAVHTADIVVYGGTSSGIAAAVQAARLGKSVLLISPERRLGGMTTNGLGATDSGDKRVIGGLALEFYTRLKDHYNNPAAWKFVRREDCADWRPNVEKVERLPDRDGRPVFREWTDFGPLDYVLEADEPPRRMVTRVLDHPDFGGTWTWTIEPHAGL